MKRKLFIIVLLIALAFQYAKSQPESGWIDKGKTILTYGDELLRNPICEN